MGQKNSSQKNRDIDRIETMLCDTYKNTDIDFTLKEVLTIKLRVGDAEKYFQIKFDYLLYFNSAIFKDRLNILYDNFSAVVEKFSKNPNNVFKMLIDFDDESEIVQEFPFFTQTQQDPVPIEYESLFTIIFEPLEIKTILFFLMTNLNIATFKDFFSQLYENIYLYKKNRTYDILYFLLPNLDFFIRNETYVVYLVNQPNVFDESLDMLSDYTVQYVNRFCETVFLTLYFKQMLNVQFNINNDAINYIDTFIPSMIPPPQFVKSAFKFDISIDNINDFISRYEREFKVFELFSENCYVNMILILLEGNGTFENKISNLDLMIKKIINIFDKNKFQKSSLVLRFLEIKEKKNFSIEENEKIQKKLNEIALTLINDSFIYSTRERVRKIIIEYYESFPIGEEEVNLNNSNENINVKVKAEMKYYKTKIYYCWFLREKHKKKMKKKIYNILIDKINEKKAFEKIFKFLFDKKYYLHNVTNYNGKVNLTDLEKMFYL